MKLSVASLVAELKQKTDQTIHISTYSKTSNRVNFLFKKYYSNIYKIFGMLQFVYKVCFISNLIAKQSIASGGNGLCLLVLKWV